MAEKKVSSIAATVIASAPRRPILGIHLRIGGAGSASAALTALVTAFPNTWADVQIFTHGPQSAKPVHIDPGFRALAARLKIRVWTHGSYLCVPWSKDKPFLMHHTVDNVRASHALGSHCVVAHLPWKPVDEVIAGILPVVKKMRAEALCDCKLMLETSATVSDPELSYESPEKLNRLSAGLIAAHLEDCVRICVDTAHIFVAGAKIRTYDEGKAYCDALDPRLIGMIQLNGNSIDPAKIKGRDQHEVPLSDADLIWRGLTYAQSGCRAFIEWAAARGLPIILEVNRRHSPDAIHAFVDQVAAA
jgi:endonuclease IV